MGTCDSCLWNPGFLALLLLKAPLTGLIRQHMILAVIATTLMWLMVYLRRHRHERMTRMSLALYYALALAGFLLGGVPF